MVDIKKIDLYELLSISVESTEQEIKSAYRKLALSCHPDKNPDNPSAIERFHQLSKALEILTDVTARSAYDKLLSARKANAIRHKKLDQKRQKLKDELEAKEKSAKEDVISEAQAEERLKREIERLRKEGSKLLETENELMRQKIQSEINARIAESLKQTEDLPKLKIIKKSKTFDFNEVNLRQYFNDYGHINCLVVTKNKRALIEFSKYNESLNVYRSRDQFKDLFSIDWIGDKPDDEKIKLSYFSNEDLFEEQEKTEFSSDFESQVLMNLGRAAERKKLIQQMKDQQQ